MEAWADKIENIIACERAGRSIVAAIGLVVLREAFDAGELPAGERSWDDFARKHFPFGLERVNELIGRTVHRGGLLRCTKCGAGAACACSCGAVYVAEHRWAMTAVPPARPPTALERAATAIGANPEKSNRAIAAEIGVGDQTVRRARQQMKDAGIDGAVDGTVRVGRDGRRRKVPKTARLDTSPAPAELERDLIQDMHPDAITPEQRWQWSMSSAAGDAIAMRAFWGREFGDWQQFHPPAELLTLAQQAVAAWQMLARDLTRRKTWQQRNPDGADPRSGSTMDRRARRCRSIGQSRLHLPSDR